MGYVPKFIHFNYIDIEYPFGVHWKHEYIKECAKAIYNTYKGNTIALVVKGMSGAMIGGAINNELHNIDSSIDSYILIIRKDKDDAHSSSLEGLEFLQNPKIVVVDDFIDRGGTIKAILKDLDSAFCNTDIRKKYDMLCVGNTINSFSLKRNVTSNYKLWKEICRRFEYVACCSEPFEYGDT